MREFLVAITLVGRSHAPLHEEQQLIRLAIVVLLLHANDALDLVGQETRWRGRGRGGCTCGFSSFRSALLWSSNRVRTHTHAQ